LALLPARHPKINTVARHPKITTVARHPKIIPVAFLPETLIGIFDLADWTPRLFLHFSSLPATAERLPGKAARWLT
jgi:hypothetical protein